MKISAILPALMVFAIGALASPVLAADAPAKHLTPQQQKMANCSHQAGTKALKGDERRAFLSSCLKADAADATTDKAAAADTNAQSKKQSCRAEAKRQHLSGEARKTFLGTCAGDRPSDIAAR